MVSPRKLGVRMRRVCMELRRLRRESGLSGTEVARRVGIVASTLSRIENHGMGLSRDLLLELLMVYRVPRPTRVALLRLHADVDLPGVLDRGDLNVNEDAETWAGFEADATLIRNYEQMLIPGLLQTFPYARAVIERGGARLDEEEIDDRTTARIARQALLRQRHHPALEVIVHEAAVRETVGDPETMRGQLVHLAEMSQRFDVSIRVVPFGVGAHPGMNGPFVIMEFANLPSLVLLENKSSDLYLDQLVDIGSYRLAWRGIEAVALSPVDSVELITEIANRLI